MVGLLSLAVGTEIVWVDRVFHIMLAHPVAHPHNLVVPFGAELPVKLALPASDHRHGVDGGGVVYHPNGIVHSAHILGITLRKTTPIKCEI